MQAEVLQSQPHILIAQPQPLLTALQTGCCPTGQRAHLQCSLLLDAATPGMVLQACDYNSFTVSDPLWGDSLLHTMRPDHAATSMLPAHYLQDGRC